MSNAGRKSEDGADGAEAEAEGRVDMTGDNGGAVGAFQSSKADIALEPAIDHRVQQHLGRKLKEAYDELVREPVPEKFHQLLEELARKEKKQ